MPEKLLTLREVSLLLEISHEAVKKLVRNGELPAYKIGGTFLRFRREQIEAIRKELPARFTRASKPEGFLKPREEGAYSESQSDRVADFFYFNDFYIISGVIILLILWVTFVI